MDWAISREDSVQENPQRLYVRLVIRLWLWQRTVMESDKWAKQRKYRNSEKGRAYRKKYQNSEKYKTWRRAYQKRKGYGRYQRYQRTPHGFLVRLYRNMESRVTGVQKLKFHLYQGKELLPREEFYEWAESSPVFKKLFVVWTDSGYERKLTPSVNRKNSKLGYTKDNMEWLTHSQNSSHTSRWNKKI